MKKHLILILLATFFTQLAAQNRDSLYIATHYDKQQVNIEMRDGVKLFTTIYSPKNKSQSYPVMYKRTPYRVAPYDADQFPSSLGPSPLFMREGFIFVYQDVRGKFMSEGVFEDMRPQVAGTNEDKKGDDIDESTDTWDSIDWLVKNLENHNGKVGMWGISYPGFYTAAAVINSHPNLTAASPQAPIADWWYDDFHHHGAFFLPHCFNFMYSFGRPRDGLQKEWGPRINHGTPDGYRFFLEELGPLSNSKKWMGDDNKFWNDLVAHPNYDEFWQAHDLLPHLKNVNCAVLTVGGWYDAEDLYGPLNIYQTIEKNNPNTQNAIVMGPWRHGGWARGDGTSLGNVHFGETPAPSTFYQNQIEFPFFMHHLKGAPDTKLPEAYMFETGQNLWHQFDTWPPQGVESVKFYLRSDGSLSRTEPIDDESFSEFISDPANPVPSHEDITTGMPRSYMTADQRFASRRPDVLVYQTDVLEEDVTLAGPLLAMLQVSTDQGDADWVVKLIDVYPDNHQAYPHQPDKKMGGYQQMVRSESIRGRFRNSYEKPEPFKSNEVETVDFPLQDVLHTFKKGHRIMIQVQSTWFPIIDRNPQKYVDNIFEATEEDFVKATHRVFHQEGAASYIEVGILKGKQ